VSVDKAYIDYTWLYSLNVKRIWFVTRAKSNIDYAVTGQHPVKGQGVIRDERISLTGPLTKDKYPRDLRLIRFFDEERQKNSYVFNEQLQACSHNDSPDIQIPMAD